jgi:hypothetical protein
MKRQGFVTAFAFFALMVTLGYVTGSRSWQGVVYLSDGTYKDSNARTPAAIKHEIDFSGLNGAELLNATQKRLVTAARAILHDEEVGIELGHFVARDESGQRRLACDHMYDRVTLVFEAEGMAADGEKPKMTIDAPCSVTSKDITRIDPIWIPFRHLLEAPATNVELSATHGSKLKFENMNGSWPVSWGLTSVRLYSAMAGSYGAEHDVQISARELHELREKPFVINWFAKNSRNQ